MNLQERRERRYQRRKAKREQKRQAIIDSIGTAEDVFTYNDMFRYGDECCKGVMWKCSTQNFHRHTFSRTAVNRRNALKGYKPKALYPFTLSERGKTRNIEAPHIDDRQIQKTVTKKVLLPLYAPRMIYDNGASLKGKGLLFSQNVLDNALRKHINKYGMNGWIIIVDFEGYFPNADRNVVKKNHECIADKNLRNVLDTITDIGSGDMGLPLGVEPSQLEMIFLPSYIDNYMTCQLRLHGFGHYMDDYHILVPPNENPIEILNEFTMQCEKYGIKISKPKTKIIKFGNPFKYCKMKRIFIGDKIIKRGCPESESRARRKIKKFAKTKMTYGDIYTSLNSTVAYFERTNNHKTVLRLKRLLYRLFGFSCDDVDEFRKRGWDAVYLPQTV